MTKSSITGYTCGGSDIGGLLRVLWSPWVAGSVVASQGPKFSYCPVQLDWPDGQRCRVKNYDVSVGGNQVGNFRGGIC